MAIPQKRIVGIIGGSGLYQLAGLENIHWKTVSSPFGAPSDALCHGVFHGLEVIFLPRHGRQHTLPPSAINYRANIDALKRCGVSDIISVSAVGSLKETLAPGHFVVVDQFIDRTFAREKSFFDAGCVAHVSMAEPTARKTNQLLADVAQSIGLPVQLGGTYLAMEGPQFSSKAESLLYRQWGADVIGMTNMPEAKLAREAQMGYSSIAMVTDYDCWHESHGHVNVADVIRVLHDNADNARKLLVAFLPRFAAMPIDNSQGIYTALDYALVTPEAVRDTVLMKKLEAVLR